MQLRMFSFTELLSKRKRDKKGGGQGGVPKKEKLLRFSWGDKEVQGKKNGVSLQTRFKSGGSSVW